MLAGCAALMGCAQTGRDEHYWTSTVRRDANGPHSEYLTRLLDRIERGDLAAWREFARAGYKYDGEYLETYWVACAELARRDPTFFLRRDLDHDRWAVHWGRCAYQYSDHKSRRRLDAIYAERIYIADNPGERREIEAFIRATTGAVAR